MRVSLPAWLRRRPPVGVVASLLLHILVLAALLHVQGPSTIYTTRRGEPLFVELPRATEEARRGTPSAPSQASTPPTPSVPRPPASEEARPAPEPPRPEPSSAKASAPVEKAPEPSKKAAPPAKKAPVVARPKRAVVPPASPPKAETAPTPAPPEPPRVASAPAPGEPRPAEPTRPEPPRSEAPKAPAPGDRPEASRSAGAAVAKPPGGPVTDIRTALRRGGPAPGGEGFGGKGDARAGIEGEPIPLDSKDPKYNDYLDRVRRMIRAKWAFPCVKDAISGQCDYYSAQLEIEFGIAKDGRVPFVSLRRNSGYDIMDEYAMNAIKLASPFPPVPDSLSKKGIPILATFRYVVDTSLTNVLR